MPSVIIDGVEYVPRGEIPPLTNERLQGCLESLTELRYFNLSSNKMRAVAWNAINALAPEIAALPEKEAFDRIHGVEEE